MADRTSSSVVVSAPHATVMRVIADFAVYPEWANGISAAEVLEQGPDDRARRVRFALNAGPIKDTYVVGYEWDGDRSVHWQLVEPGTMVTEMTGAYRLTDDGPGTKVSYELTVGTRVPLGLLKRRAEKTIIDTALRGLKARVESLQD
jgi:carbon monoxide dehydrogenase subunit G